jgi:hypothetical protein
MRRLLWGILIAVLLPQRLRVSRPPRRPRPLEPERNCPTWGGGS